MTRFQLILVPVDFSQHSTRALEVAIDLARTYQGRLHLVHSYPFQQILVSPYPVAVPPAFERDLHGAADKQLAAWAERARAAGIQVETSTSSDPPSDAIARCAEEIGADLIVMGTRGFSGLKHVLLGSVAERTLRIARCPVLAVKAD